MSQELTVSLSMQFKKGAVNAPPLSFSQKLNVAGTNFKSQTQDIPTTAGGTLLDIGGLANVGFYMIINLDPTNPVNLLSGISGSVLDTIPANSVSFGYFPSGVTAPALIATGATVKIWYQVVEQ